jgi:hypothetical protein
MNKEIQVLADQCSEWVTGTLDGDYESFDKERFAQGIVELCAQQISRTNLEDTDGGDWEVLRAAATQLREKFNIK